MMPLRQLVERYLAIANGFGNAAALSAFGHDKTELEKLFSSYNEDYHISRFFHFSNVEGAAFSVDGEAVTHISIDGEIRDIL